MQICPKCKNTNAIDDDHFCYKDGTPLVEQPLCQHCGRGLLEGIDIFCAHCGKKVEINGALSANA